jgi:hypothetical protein
LNGDRARRVRHEVGKKRELRVVVLLVLQDLEENPLVLICKEVWQRCEVGGLGFAAWAHPAIASTMPGGAAPSTALDCRKDRRE